MRISQFEKLLSLADSEDDECSSSSSTSSSLVVEEQPSTKKSEGKTNFFCPSTNQTDQSQQIPQGKKEPSMGKEIPSTNFCPVQASPPTLKQHSIFEDYEVLWGRPAIGVGASGQIRPGLQLSTGKLVALKFLPNNYATYRELTNHLTCLSKNKGLFAEILDVYLNKLNSTIFAGHGAPSQPFHSAQRLRAGFQTKEWVVVVLRYYEGGDLFDRLQSFKGNKISEDQARLIMLQLVDAVSLSSEENIVHGDLKPENILLHSTEKKDFRLVVADFGLSTSSLEDRLQFSPYYVAPEVLKNSGKRSLRSDCWSLGVILYILLIGYPPFSTLDNSNQNVLSAKLRAQILTGRMHKFDPEWSSLSDEVRDLISRLLVVDPASRLSIEELSSHPWIASFAADKIEEEEAQMSD